MSDLIDGNELLEEIQNRYKSISNGYVEYGETAAFELNWIEQFIKEKQANEANKQPESKALALNIVRHSTYLNGGDFKTEDLEKLFKTEQPNDIPMQDRVHKTLTEEELTNLTEVKDYSNEQKDSEPDMENIKARIKEIES
jgi:hypothetical protein